MTQKGDLTDFLASRSHTLVDKTHTSIESATTALVTAAIYIRTGQPLPRDVAIWLADAISASMAKPPKNRAKALTDELGLTDNNARKKAGVTEVGLHVDSEINDGRSKTKAQEITAENLGFSLKTIQRRYADYLRIKQSQNKNKG